MLGKLTAPLKLVEGQLKAVYGGAESARAAEALAQIIQKVNAAGVTMPSAKEAAEAYRSSGRSLVLEYARQVLAAIRELE